MLLQSELVFKMNKDLNKFKVKHNFNPLKLKCGDTLENLLNSLHFYT